MVGSVSAVVNEINGAAAGLAFVQESPTARYKHLASCEPAIEILWMVTGGNSRPCSLVYRNAFLWQIKTAPLRVVLTEPRVLQAELFAESARLGVCWQGRAILSSILSAGRNAAGICILTLDGVAKGRERDRQ